MDQTWNDKVSSSNKQYIIHNRVKIIQLERILDKQVLVEHILKFQITSVKKSKEKIFQKNVNTLVAKLKKNHNYCIVSHILREQSGTLSANTTTKNKMI